VELYIAGGVNSAFIAEAMVEGKRLRVVPELRNTGAVELGIADPDE
jgi:hypothetical protein